VNIKDLGKKIAYLHRELANRKKRNKQVDPNSIKSTLCEFVVKKLASHSFILEKKSTKKHSSKSILTNSSKSRVPDNYIAIPPERYSNSIHHIENTIGTQTDKDFIVENLRDYTSVLKQRIRTLEHELRLKNEVIVSLSNGNAYLQQQTISQLNVIQKLTPNIIEDNSRLGNTKSGEDRSALKDVENRVKSKEKIKRSLTSCISRKYSKNKFTFNEFDRYKKRNQESSVGELLKWGTPDKPNITSKITERSFESSEVQALKDIEEQLAKEIKEKEQLELKYNSLKGLRNSLASNKRQRLECNIKERANKIKEMESEIRSFKAYYGI